MNSSYHPISSFSLVAIFAMACVAAPGCKSHGNNELLERELRCQENRIYQLEDELDEMCYALESSRRENQSIKKEIAGGDSGAGGRFAPSVTVPPAVSAPGTPAITAPQIEAPPLELPKDEAPRFVPKSKRGAPPLEEAPSFKPESLEEAPKFQPRGSSKPSTRVDGSEPLLQPASARAPLSGDASTIEKLVLNRQLTGGWNPDGKHGDEGVFVAIEPRDAENKLVEAVGEVSIAVLDPLQTGAAARVARWDFATDEAATHFRKGPLGQGLEFELPWPSNPPTSRDLRLFVRLTTPDGRKIETDAKIRVTPCDQEGKGWASRVVKKDVVDQSVAEKNADDGPLLTPTPRRPNRTRTATRPKWSPDR